jgi:peptide subunit release factor 1 (eRF1)
VPNSEIVKTRVTRYIVNQVAIDFLIFSESYRRIRGNFRYKGFECYSCGKHFEDGEKMSLIFTNKGNKVVCHKCGIRFKEELETEVVTDATDQTGA